MQALFKMPPSESSFTEIAAPGNPGDAAQQASAEVAEGKQKGEIAEIRNLYEGPKKGFAQWEYQTDYPEDLISKGPPQKKIPPTKLYAIVVHQNRTGLKSKPLRVQSVTVQSPHIKAVLADLFASHGNIADMRQRNPVFEPPYRELYDVWPAYEAAMEAATDSVAAEHLRLFHEMANKDVQRMRSRQVPLDRHSRATFDTLFTCFPPGQIVYKRCGDFDRFFKVHSAEYTYGDRPYTLHVTAASLEWDGNFLGWADKGLNLDRFPGTKKLVDLEFFPATLHPQYEKIKASLLERGRRWEAFKSKPHTVVEYDGPTADTRDANRWGNGGGTIMVRGRVVIDAAAFGAYGGRNIYLLSRDFKKELKFDDGENDDDDDDPDPVTEDNSDSDSELEDEQPQEPTETYEEVDEDKLTEEMLMVASHEIHGFYLKNKTWVKLYIDHANPVPWNYEAFDRLVLPSNYKNLIISFVESQAENRDVFDDIIEGKGQGIIMLLHGSAGLGKTLTAEAVSDRLTKPLYSVQAGELGSNADDVERKLEEILEMAEKWDAVLLLDEADVFLEQRTHNNLERNKIVTVFLRLLEYYRGILFLTTNRVEAFDEAFRSRIHLKINYPDLDVEAKVAIWNNFIALSRKKNGSNVTAKDIGELAQLPFNGREIKNLVKTAQLLATREKRLLEMSHFKVCLEVLEEGKSHQGETLMI